MAQLISSKYNEMTARKWMRYSGLLLIPLAWGHVLIQDVLVGVDRIDLNYVSLRCAGHLLAGVFMISSCSYLHWHTVSMA